MSEFTSGRVNGRSRPRGYAKWQPQAKTQVVIDHVIEVLHEYADYLPLTVRQVFYRLVGAHEFPKDEAAYHRLCDIMVRARRARIIPFSYLRDDGVMVAQDCWYKSPADFWDEVGERVHRYQRDRQQGQDYRVELWCEAAGMMPQLARVAEVYSVPVYSAGGFASLTAVQDIAQRAICQNVPTVLLHVGDYVPSGQAVFDHMAEDVQEFVQVDRVLALQKVIPVRVALTGDQVERYTLPTAPAKASDTRSAKWTGGTCQLEALPPDTLAGIVREAVEGWFDLDALADQIAAEKADQVEIRARLPEGES